MSIYASANLGKGFVRSFAAARAKAIVLLARSYDRLQEAAKELRKEFPGTAFLPLQCDIQNEISVRATFKRIQDSFGTADVLVNNAGAFREQNDLRSVSIENFWSDVVSIIAQTAMN